MKPFKCNDMKKVILSIAILPLTMLMTSYAFAQVPERCTVERINEELFEVSLFYEDGNLMEKGLMIDGVFTGQWLRYNEIGVLIAEANFQNGAKDGVWRIYNNDGQIIYEMEYSRDVRIMARSFDDSGTLVSYRTN
ncbi:MAG TPA: hypothetical protein DHW15_03035 [Bacteroidetes bacterium]|jgi:hypothetical protein|nr:hypothetical protein [Bacteroidota bacterium]